MRFATLSLLLASTLFAVTACAAEPPQIKPLPVASEQAFPNLTFDRALLLTYAPDDSDRIFVGEQRGKIYVFENDQDVQEKKLFLDFSDKVTYKDTENEEGFLGLAFHPNYKENGEFFVYYTTSDAPHTSVVSRFTVSAVDPNKADPESEVELMRIPQPFWNHNGGTIVFGPDGYLYIALGDGGKANDAFKTSQDLTSLLATILRIDVDNKQGDLNYAIPADNPFVDRDDARGEIWAYGLRNPWRIAFDPKTGVLWCADVGQDLWEEVNLIVKGGNYGWNLREGMHPFEKGGRASGPRPDLIEPIYEYHHDEGKSITGGNVYRGSRVPALQGKYLLADYVTGFHRALDYDYETGELKGVYSIA
ncbi:MAG: PQQ-dependent sugar dehydrogenase, partial [Pirellulales bacterium]